MKYQIIHKLTKKPIRNRETLEVMEFDNIDDAKKLLDIKNKNMHATFYEIKAV